jgi:thiol-disulfide isomerase/thioredoxin
MGKKKVKTKRESSESKTAASSDHVTTLLMQLWQQCRVWSTSALAGTSSWIRTTTERIEPHLRLDKMWASLLCFTLTTALYTYRLHHYGSGSWPSFLDRRRLRPANDDVFPLTQFATLQKLVQDHAASSSSSQPLVLVLVFLAAWCPYCAPVYPALPPLVAAAAATESSDDPHFVLVYVSSDDSAAALDRACPAGMHALPFTEIEMRLKAQALVPTAVANPERQRLKQHVRICAAREAADLGIEQRTSGLPTILLLDASSSDARVFYRDNNAQHLAPAAHVLHVWTQAYRVHQSTK